MNGVPTYIIGAGGHGRVVLSVLRAMDREPDGFIDLKTGEVDGIPIVGNDNCQRMQIGPVVIVIGLGSVDLAGIERRKAVYERYERQFGFGAVIHPSAVVSPTARVLVSSQVMPRAVIQCGAKIGHNVIINSGAIVEHDCVIGDHCHIAPGVTLSGNVTIGEGCHIGTGATVIQGVTIGKGVLVGAGAVVVDDIPDGARVCGVPARQMREAA